MHCLNFRLEHVVGVAELDMDGFDTVDAFSELHIQFLHALFVHEVVETLLLFVFGSEAALYERCAE